MNLGWGVLQAGLLELQSVGSCKDHLLPPFSLRFPLRTSSSQQLLGRQSRDRLMQTIWPCGEEMEALLQRGLCCSMLCNPFA